MHFELVAQDAVARRVEVVRAVPTEEGIAGEARVVGDFDPVSDRVDGLDLEDDEALVGLPGAGHGLGLGDAQRGGRASEGGAEAHQLSG